MIRSVRKMWFLQERRLLREMYGIASTIEIAARLGRTASSVRREASRLGLCGMNHAPYRWTNSRKQRFVNTYKVDPKMAAERFGLSRQSANSYASRWGANVRKAWTEAEDSIIREFWPRHEESQIVARIDRTMGSIRSRAYKIGLRRPAIHEWTRWRFT